jgi:hypothetical protein
MDRQTVYPGAIPLETDMLNTNKYAMIGLAKLSSALMGAGTYLRGLACTPSSPASMVVNVAKGEIYSTQNIDGTAYSSLPADTVNTILKQGIILGSTAFTLVAPTTAGQSVNYLVQIAYTDTDGGSTVLPYYNAANPSVAFSGPGGLGTAQYTVRSGVCTVAIKAGVAATTGTQTTPSADAGYTAAWVITVPQGATTITSANISQAPGAPFIPVSGVVDAVQKMMMTHSADTGAANAYTANYSPAITALTDGMELTFKANVTNTGASTFTQNGLTAYPIIKIGGSVLTGGEIIAGGFVKVKWNATLSSWVLTETSGSGATIVNLGLGTAALRAIGVATGNVPDMSSFASLLAQPGYQRLPGGFIVQWGTATIPVAGNVTVSFPLSITAGYMTLVSPIDTSSTNNYRVSISTSTNNSITLASTNTASVTGAMWMSIGKL